MKQSGLIGREPRWRIHGTAVQTGGEVGSATVHLSLQGKGGVGKSLVASLLAQYFKHRKGVPVRCIDADPVNQTLAQYKELDAERLNLLAGRVG